jgi:hypothetical protein
MAKRDPYHDGMPGLPARLLALTSGPRAAGERSPLADTSARLKRTQCA